MPKFEFDLMKIDLRVVISALNFLTLIFVGGMIWQGQVGSMAQLRKDIDYVRNEMTVLRANDRSIAVLQNDVMYIKEGIARIERIMPRLNN